MNPRHIIATLTKPACALLVIFFPIIVISCTHEEHHYHTWKVPLGEYPELTERGIPPTGTHNLGGPVVTAGGLVFIGATKDEKFRVFDKHTGEIL